MPVSKAQALVPGLQVLPSDPAADVVSLQRLALWVLQRVSPIVAVDPLRVCWRLQLLSKMEHPEPHDEQVFP